MTSQFHSAEGAYQLIDEFVLDSPNKSLHAGTFVTLITIKSNENADLVPDSNTVSPDQSVQPSSTTTRFVQIPLQPENVDKNSFSFLPKKPKKPGKLTNGFSNSNSSISSSVAGTSSSFVSKIMANENLAKILASKASESTYIFFNVGRAFVWADYFAKPKEPLSVIYFKEAHVSCHDVNSLTRESMDTVIGFNTGDIVIYSPISGKYTNINRGGIINKSGVKCVKWVPGSENLFVAGHEDGAIVTYDKDKEDQPFTFTGSADDNGLFVSKFIKTSKSNPHAWWQLSKRAITAIAFSPDCQHIAATSLDGTLKVIDYSKEELCDTYQSYFAGLLCVSWSPDGRFIITGGQDDLVTIWSFRGRIIARCHGHTSWVNTVSFDKYNCSERNYRFASGGEDTKICMWDFSVASLRRPRVNNQAPGGTLRKSRVDLDKKETLHPALPRREVAVLEAITTTSIHLNPICCIFFSEDGVVTTDRSGIIKIWARPGVEGK